MQILIESTAQHTTIDGTPCRVWDGTTASGLRCLVFVRLLAVAAHDDQRSFQELVEQLQPAELTPLVEVLRRVDHG